MRTFEVNDRGEHLTIDELRFNCVTQVGKGRVYMREVLARLAQTRMLRQRNPVVTLQVRQHLVESL